MIAKYFLFIIVVLTIFNINDGKILRKSYPFDDDLDHLEVMDTFELVITFIDSNAEKSILEIDADESIHDCCIHGAPQSDLKMFHSQRTGQTQYPSIIIYFRLRKPPSSIILRQQTKLTMENTMKTDNFRIELYDNAHARMNVEILSNLKVHIQNTAQLVISGFVAGPANIVVHNGGELNARSCSINDLTIEVNEHAVVYVSDKQYMRPAIRKSGKIRPRTYTKKGEDFSFMKEIKELIGFYNNNTATKIMDQSTCFFLLFVLIVINCLFF